MSGKPVNIDDMGRLADEMGDVEGYDHMTLGVTTPTMRSLTMSKDPFWKRSSFGTLLYHGGAMAIGYLVGGRVPTEEAWLILLGHALIVAGYQVARPTGKVA